MAKKEETTLTEVVASTEHLTKILEVNPLQESVDILKAELSSIDKDYELLLKDNAELLAANNALREKLELLEEATALVSPTVEGDCVWLDGKCHKILLVEEAKELILCIQRSEVEDDRTVIVVDRHGV